MDYNGLVDDDNDFVERTHGNCVCIRQRLTMSESDLPLGVVYYCVGPEFYYAKDNISPNDPGCSLHTFKDEPPF